MCSPERDGHNVLVARSGEGGFQESCVGGRQVTVSFGGSLRREGCTRPTTYR